MPGALLPERPSHPPVGSARVPTVSGRKVLLAVFGLGLTLVLGVGTFAALTRPPRRPHVAPAASAAEPAAPAGQGW